MKPDNYKAFTFFDWDNKSRPEVQLHGLAAILTIGGYHTAEISAKDSEELADQLEGYADIFRDAAEFIKNEKPQEK